MGSASIFSPISSTPLETVVLFPSQLFANRKENLPPFHVPVLSFPFSLFRLRIDFRMLSTVLTLLSRNPLSLLCKGRLLSSEATSSFSPPSLFVREAGSEVMLLGFNTVLLFILSFSKGVSKQVDSNH